MEPEPSAASWPLTWLNAVRVTSHCCAEARSRREINGHVLPDDHRHHATVNTIRKIERLGAQVTTASVDITDIDQVKAWLSDHIRNGGRPVRGIVHAAGSVDDRLLVNMTERDFTNVMAPKITGARVLHNAFQGERSGVLRDVRVGRIGHRVARPR